MVWFSLILALVAYIFMVVLNVLANALPLNGITTGAVSFKYPNLFQPSGITFSIWGIIYLLLLIYIVVQFFQINRIESDNAKNLFIRMNLLFALSSLPNGMWLLAWHYDKMILSTIIMLALLVTLIVLAKLSSSSSFLIRTSFSVYCGWITVASIANMTITLVKMNVRSDGLNAIIMTIAVLLVGLVISIVWIIREKDYIYGFVVLWAYLGILIRHLKQENLTKMYPTILITLIMSLVCLLVVNGIMMHKTLVHV